MNQNNLLRNVGFNIQLFGTILLLFVGIIFWVIYAKEKFIPLRFLLIYTAYFIYSFFVLISYGKWSKIFKTPFDETLKLTKLRMNHSLVFSLFFIALSIPLLSLKYLQSSWWVFLGALVILSFGIFYLYKSYYLRFKKLEAEAKEGEIKLRVRK